MSIILTEENQEEIQQKILKDYDIIKHIINPNVKLFKFLIDKSPLYQSALLSIFDFNKLNNDEYDEIFEYIIDNNNDILRFTKIPSLKILEKCFKKDPYLFNCFDGRLLEKQKIIKIYIYHYGSYIDRLENITYDDLKIAVRTYPQMLKHNPSSGFTHKYIDSLTQNQYFELCNITINEQLYHFDFINYDRLSNEMYNELLLNYINCKFKYRDLDQKAINQIIKFNDYEIYKTCVKNFDLFKHIPIKYKTDEIIKIALDKNINNVEFINNFNTDIYNIIIEKLTIMLKINFRELENKLRTDFLNFIPSNFQDEKILLLVCYNEIENISLIKKEFLTKEFYILLFDNNIRSIKHIPTYIFDEISYDSWFKIINKLENNSYTCAELFQYLIKFIPKKYLTDEMIGLCMKINIYEVLNCKYLPYDLIKKLIKKNEYLLPFIWKSLNENEKLELLEIHIESFPLTITNFSVQYQTKDICKIAIKNDLRLNKSLRFNFEINELFDNQVKDFLDECPVCKSNKKYYAKYKCNKSHIICLDCIEKCNTCYYKCDDGKIDFTNLYNDISFFKDF